MDIQKIKDFFLRDEFALTNGIELTDIGEGYARTCVAIEPRHLNALGVVQGGVLFSLADLAFAAATNSHGTFTMTSSANITFVRSSNSGTLQAEAREVVNHHRLPYCEVRITDAEGALVALFTASGYRKQGAELPFK